ncbi:MAG: type II toxin-antitoxin system HicB family antitoxin [Ignavibacteriae bacterium]|nr:type II toxin-antitoxin system HicB family antitoxin [Ignavibacteriota bacterium]
MHRLSSFIQAALRRAKYEILENNRYYAEIPELQGVWVEAETLEACRSELIEVIEGWLLLKLRDGDVLPILDGIDLNQKVAADA